ncbi:protein-methionine-sulfoxide reductase catalytic subunit MsrP [Polynucleobacter sp. AM-26B4]|jgi:sulfoxide reductase catalytic subunit YedY|uniref:protein-methionine-sulfoxide reductase catalytic subunit MsrP n=1 Tax=Polynucleobacter sp. AM-26B4 TaxID=2689103 RepID=UPI001C0ADF95|nr:protein-methionine-sulfoxide reductase catalytic subunit MsrP [Polynucleobacter sp. AM-26B4]MBU3586030.1 protein-methionine-sulfoxide reductase catalytic subunit MsrP [Polynucleobacter sp. AM-26B4]
MKNTHDILASEITPQNIFEKRRQLIKLAAMGAFGLSQAEVFSRSAFAQSGQKLPAKVNPQFFVADKLTSYKDVTTYNNFYEFGTDKADPARNAHTLKTRPWTVSVEGLVNKPKVWDIDALLKLAPMEERVYRFRCVEGWSMVIPWIGYSLSHLIKASEPQGSAKYIEFISLADPKQMPGVNSRVLNWPYTEGLRLDEAMNPLALLTFGLYGEVLPNQNGAPIRINVPWKYGFKSAKSIVKIRITDKEPATSWKVSAPYEYGFYSNVNPEVNHPRWSQATERRIGAEGGMFAPKIKTLPFNGYAEQVAHLYKGMDLRKFY